MENDDYIGGETLPEEGVEPQWASAVTSDSDVDLSPDQSDEADLSGVNDDDSDEAGTA